MTRFTSIAGKRLAEAMFSHLAASNRGSGSGGGTGSLAFANLGRFSGTSLGTYSTAGAGTWTDITGSAFSVQITRPTFFTYWIEAGCTTTSSVLDCYIRGNIVGFDTTFVLYYAGQGPFEGTTWYFPGIKGPIPPGLYTCKLQAATDNGSSITVNRAAHQFFDLGQ